MTLIEMLTALNRLLEMEKEGLTDVVVLVDDPSTGLLQVCELEIGTWDYRNNKTRMVVIHTGAS